MAFFFNNLDLILRLLWQHVQVTGSALLIAAVIALPLGWLLYTWRGLVGPVMGVLGVIYTIPSIALIIFLIPFFGLNARSVLVALVLYCQVVLVRNVIAGLDAIDPSVREAARGMGMNRWQIAWRVEFPLALPVILAGMRIAAVVSVAIATVGARFGAGGLGTLLFDGIAQAGRIDKIWIGALMVGALALTINIGLQRLEVLLTPQLQLNSQKG
jgi:osmoprotectant transport system permease protein